MSEYQSYEFLAIDRPLLEKELERLRSVSTRAEISPTRFWNEYHWGDFEGDPAELMKRYFDAHLYFANWGTHRLMLRLPKARVDEKSLKAYFVGAPTSQLKKMGEHLILDLTSDTEEPEYDEDHGSLAVLSSVRAELLGGDLRPAYLAWLLAAQEGNVDDDDTEPPVPNGLATLTAAQEGMIEFLRIDIDLVAAAASGSAAARDDRELALRWLTKLSSPEKDAWLRRAVEEPDLALGGDLLRAFRATLEDPPAGLRRTVAALRALAEKERTKRIEAETAQERKAEAAAEAARRRHLAKVARNVDGTWAQLENLVETSGYDEALKLAVDLRDLATRDGSAATFARRFEDMRKRHLRRRGFFDRWKRANDRDTEE